MPRSRSSAPSSLRRPQVSPEDPGFFWSESRPLPALLGGEALTSKQKSSVSKLDTALPTCCPTVDDECPTVIAQRSLGTHQPSPISLEAQPPSFIDSSRQP